jgi:integrase
MGRKKVTPEVGSVTEKHKSFFWSYYSEGRKVSEKLGRVADLGGNPKSKGRAVAEANRRLAAGGGPVKAVNQSNAPRTANTLLCDIAERFLEWAKSEKRPSTYAGYKQLYHAHIKAHLGGRRVVDYQPYHAGDFFKSLALGGTLNTTTVRHVRAVLSGVFAHAISEGHASMNPVAALGRSRYTAKKKSLSKDEQPRSSLDESRAILAALDSDSTAMPHAIMSLAILPGLRRAEIAGLKWSDIDLDAATLHLRRSAWQGKVSETAKTEDSTRKLALPPRVLASLSRWKRLRPLRLNGYVYENERGNPVNLAEYSKRTLRPLFIANKLTWRGYYAGRRGATDQLREHAARPQDIADMLGHSLAVEEKYYRATGVRPGEAALLAYDQALEPK